MLRGLVQQIRHSPPNSARTKSIRDYVNFTVSLMFDLEQDRLLYDREHVYVKARAFCYAILHEVLDLSYREIATLYNKPKNHQHVYKKIQEIKYFVSTKRYPDEMSKMKAVVASLKEVIKPNPTQIFHQWNQQ